MPALPPMLLLLLYTYQVAALSRSICFSQQHFLYFLPDPHTQREFGFCLWPANA
jgi:hypothetical protein